LLELLLQFRKLFTLAKRGCDPNRSREISATGGEATCRRACACLYRGYCSLDFIYGLLLEFLLQYRQFFTLAKRGCDLNRSREITATGGEATCRRACACLYRGYCWSCSYSHERRGHMSPSLCMLPVPKSLLEWRSGIRPGPLYPRVGVKTVTEIPDRPSFISEKYEKQ
jgi:hypothetical protein